VADAERWYEPGEVRPRDLPTLPHCPDCKSPDPHGRPCEQQLAERGASLYNPIIRGLCRDAFGRPLRTPAIPPSR
jgi:hypothetical protein